jgi:hypothetical protein
MTILLYSLFGAICLAGIIPAATGWLADHCAGFKAFRHRWHVTQVKERVGHWLHASVAGDRAAAVARAGYYESRKGGGA